MITATTTIPVEHYHLDWVGFAAVMGILVFSLVYGIYETQPVRRLVRSADARIQELLDAAAAEPWPQVSPRLAPDAAPDPEGLDATRPADIDVCDVCGGDGAFYRVVDPFEGRSEAEECWACNGTGIRGAA